MQHYSLHDGPGIRTIVFFKGCPMRCRWCCNPESQRYDREISYVENKCIGRKECGFCGTVCESGAIGFSRGGKAAIDFEKCSACRRCAEICPSRAIKTEGRSYETEELLDLVEKDSVFYGYGEGGLTISGGEPLTHPDFLLSLLRGAKKRRLHTAIETCGYGDYSVLAGAAEYLDMIHYDIKSLDEEKHLAYTGCSNRKILENFERLCRDYPMLDKKVRTPVIPGFNDSPEEIREIARFLEGRQKVTYELLPYHSFGRGKYAALGRHYEMGDRKLDMDFFNTCIKPSVKG